jgi:hypothetical protein
MVAVRLSQQEQLHHCYGTREIDDRRHICGLRAGPSSSSARTVNVCVPTSSAPVRRIRALGLFGYHSGILAL